MKKPPRPLLPLLLVPLAAGWGGIVVAAELVYQGITLPSAAMLGVAVLVAVLLALKIRQVTSRSLLITVLTLGVFLTSLTSGTLFYQALAEQVLQGEQLKGELRLIVVEDSSATEFSASSEALVEQESGSPLRVRIFWDDANEELPKGSHLTARGTFAALKEHQKWLFEKGVVGTVSLSSIENRGFSPGLWGALDEFRYHNTESIQSTGSAGAPLLAGVLLGQRELLQNTMLEQDFVTCGLTHLIAVSGSHLAVVAALVGWFLRRLPLRRVIEIIILLSILALYVMLTGLQPSAIRSAIMAGAASCSSLVGRRGHAPSALTAAALGMLIIHPANAYSLGFWLSVLAVMGITLFTGLVSHWIAAAAPLRVEQPGAVSQALALTVTATASTMPLTLPTFAVLSLVGPFANLIVAPLVSLILILGMLALVVLPFVAPLGILLLSAAAKISELCGFLAEQMAQLPWASIPLTIPLVAVALISTVCAIILYASWHVPTARTLRLLLPIGGIAACLLTQIAFVLTPPQLIVMDVGQGDALLVRDRGNAVLIDTGASESALVHALARNNVRELDAVIITHLDSDHAGALKRLRGLVNVEAIYFARGLLEHQSRHEYITQAQDHVGEQHVSTLSQGETLRVGPILSLQVLWPEKEAQEGSNEESICLLLCSDRDGDGTAEQQALLAGDAEHEVIATLLKRFSGLKASIIKVGHHGSKKALTTEQVQELGSSIALISVGAHNRFGHPTQETLEILAAANCRILRTDELGDIVCSFRDGTFELRSAQPDTF